MPAAAAPRFRRPTPDDAVDVARELLDGGERVDVLAVARRLGVSRATVHRWFGTRDQLLQALFERLAEEFIGEGRAQLGSEGDERVYELVRRIAERSATYEPLRLAAAREPAIVLRLVLAEDGAVFPRVVAAVTELLAATRTPAQVERLAEAIDTFVAAAIAMHWSVIATGGRPDAERYVRLGRALLSAR